MQPPGEPPSPGGSDPVGLVEDAALSGLTVHGDALEPHTRPNNRWLVEDAELGNLLAGAALASKRDTGDDEMWSHIHDSRWSDALAWYVMLTDRQDDLIAKLLAAAEDLKSNLIGILS